jgi:gliding motility-associated-like protein
MTKAIQKFMKGSKGISLLLLFALSPIMGIQAQSGCVVDFQADTININCGDTTTLEISDRGVGISDDFNDKKLDPGWNSTQTVNFSNPCGSGPDGSPYAWLGSAADTPRILTTAQMAVACGGKICFDFKMAEQGNPEPCEGPDLPEEGVYLQYSTDTNSGWNTIQYFNPDTSCCGCGGGCGGYPPSPFINWDNYCFQIPPAAQTDTTVFRWSQHKAGSGQDFDHWGIDNVEITGATCDSVVAYSFDSINYSSDTSKKVAPLTNKDYTGYGITDSTGSGDTCSTSVHVNVTGVPDLNVTATDSNLGCNDTVGLNAMHNTVGSITYKWSPNYNITDTTVQNPQAWPYRDTTYQIIAHQAGSPQCADTGSVPLSVNVDTCLAPRPSYRMPSCKGASDGRIVAELIGCEPPFKVLWRDSTGALIKQDSPVTGMDTLTGLESGLYTVSTVDTSGCQADTTFFLPEPKRIKTTLTNDTTICKGGTAQLQATPSGGNGPPYTFHWNEGLSDTLYHEVSPNSAKTYKVAVEDSNGCMSDTASTKVEVTPNLFVSTIPDDTICPGGATKLSTITATGGSGIGYKYTWTNMAGDTVGTEETVTVEPQTTMSYVIHLEDNCETPTATDTMTVELFPGYGGADPRMAVSDSEGCRPHEVEFTTLTPSYRVESTFWSFGDGTTSNDSGVTRHTYRDSGCYDVTLEVTSTNGCVEDSTFENVVCARPYPQANYVIRPNRGNVLDPEVSLVDRSVSAEEYEWRFEHVDSTSSMSSLDMEFPDDGPGSYEVEQWVANKYGCADSITKTVIIEGVHQLYIPNAFRPNGNGQNDVFRPQGEGISDSEYHLRIYSRDGGLVFQTKDPNEGWRGRIDGSEAPAGVYVWEIQLKDEYTGKEYEKSGHVTLLR